MSSRAHRLITKLQQLVAGQVRQFHSICGDQIAQKRRRLSRSLQIETLQGRELMAADLTAIYDPTVRQINVEGTEAADSILIYQREGMVSIENLPIVDLVSGVAYDSLASSEIDWIRVEALDGDDTIYFDDTFAAEAHVINFNVIAGDGADLITTGRGADLINAGSGDDSVAAGPGEDTVYGGPGYDTLCGEDGRDFLYGQDDADMIFGGEGDDSISGGNSYDTLFGEGGWDKIWGDEGGDALYGGPGDDRLWGGDGIDNLEGGDGNDILRGDADEDWLYGDAGNDWLYGGADMDHLYGSVGNDRLFGEDGDDELFAGGLIFALGQQDNDFLQGGEGADLLDDSFGTNTLDYSEGVVGVNVNLSTAQVTGGNASGDVLHGNFRNVYGTQGNDRIIGDAGNNYLWGLGGNDQLNGLSGTDYVYGGDGDDTLLGGDGNDFLWGEAGRDQLNGQAGLDVIRGGYGDDTLVAIDGVQGDNLDGESGADVYWVDGITSFFGPRDQVAVTSGDVVRSVLNFTNAADKSLNGDRIADPSTFEPSTMITRPYRSFMGNPLFSDLGPRLEDIDQNGLGDCYALSGLGAVVRQSPDAIRSRIVDFNDGTFGVKLGNNYYRIDDDLPVIGTGSRTPVYAGLGLQGSLWVALFEKAFAYYRTGANSYASLEGGWSNEFKLALGATDHSFLDYNQYTSKVTLGNELVQRFRNGECVTFDFTGTILWGNVPLIRNHSYVVSNVTVSASGKPMKVTLYNPWGSDGAGNDGSDDGFVTLDANDLFNQNARMAWGRVSVV
ncbi:MAG: hypothetical protein KDB03_03770 [Planctomycetales bacterium]|nr:hypothetical protein [Planctomycetales bacterium]